LLESSLREATAWQAPDELDAIATFSGRRAGSKPIRYRARSEAGDRAVDSLNEINLDDANARPLRLAPQLGSVLARGYGLNKGRFLEIGRLQTGSLEFRLLVCLPIIILSHDRSILVP
jgi:hypothetical protein